MLNECLKPIMKMLMKFFLCIYLHKSVFLVLLSQASVF